MARLSICAGHQQSTIKHQLLFRLEQLVTFERSISLMCIPNRHSADCELTRLKREYGKRLVKAVIRKDKPGRTGNSRTYTLRYTVKETEVRTLF